MNNKEKNYPVSVLMPVYNCATYLDEAIKSILNQTFADFEFIIVNDGSTDHTPEILNEYAKKDSRIKVIHQPNGGIVKALNRGLKEAKGEWIFRMDGDDIALPHRFAKQIQMIKNDPALVLLGGWCQQIDAENNSLKINKYPADHEHLVASLEKNAPFFPHPTACFRRKEVMALGGYRERFRHAEDYDLWLQLSSIGKLGCCQSIVLRLRKHSNNVSNFDFGHGDTQQIRGVAALICHFSRKAGLADPCQMPDKPWAIFLRWIKNKMHKQYYFKNMQGWEMLRNIWYINHDISKLKRSMLLLKAIMKKPSLFELFWWKFRKNVFILKLSKESRIILRELISC